MTTHKPIPELTDDEVRRFWARVPTPTDGCWEWMGGRSSPRPIMQIRGERYYAYRVMFFLVHDLDPAELQINHHCDNPWCVRPSHIYAGTALDNARDAKDRGLLKPPGHLPGEHHPNALLTNEQAVALLWEVASSADSIATIASRYGICETAAGSIVRGERGYDLPFTIRRGYGWRPGHEVSIETPGGAA